MIWALRLAASGWSPTIRIRAGDTVQWRNVSMIDHTVTADKSLAANPANVILPAGVAAQLRSELAGDLLAPDSPGYDEARAIWNAMIDRRPGLVIRCASARDVQRAVRFAAAHDLLAAVRGGGHNIAGNAVCEGGLQIDLSAMKAVTVDASARRAVNAASPRMTAAGPTAVVVAPSPTAAVAAAPSPVVAVDVTRPFPDSLPLGALDVAQQAIQLFQVRARDPVSTADLEVRPALPSGTSAAVFPIFYCATVTKAGRSRRSAIM